MIEEINDVSETSLKGYPLIMAIGERVNKFYNYHNKIIKKPFIEDLVELKKH